MVLTASRQLPRFKSSRNLVPLQETMGMLFGNLRIDFSTLVVLFPVPPALAFGLL